MGAFADGFLILIPNGAPLLIGFKPLRYTSALAIVQELASYITLTLSPRKSRPEPPPD